MKINTQHKAVGEYYRTLKEVQEQGGTNEEALRRAFQGLLVTFGREQGWTLMEEYKLANGSKPDGTLIDRNTLQRGFWEAKDAKDDLETEIKKKIARGYPLTNTIFEDTRRAVLYQQGKRVDTFDLTQPKWLADLLEQFFGYTEPAIAQFEQAVEEFKGRIPDLARGLLKLITEERAGKNKAFQRAFEEFHTLCRGALNPQISVAAIDEMLVQHLLTERLFRTIFNNPDFIHRNVIAAEIEKVIDALTSHAFNRNDFLKGLDRFYLAIEEAARTISDWTEKQRFLNTVYERFFQGFSVKQADTYGIVYTPQEIVDFMVASVDEVLRSEFGKDLSSPGVQILDPCTGTGNFIVNILRRVSLGALQQKYTRDLFANEIMLLPYYIASLNIEHAYYEKAGHYQPFDGICFADTLDMVTEGQPAQLPGFSEANTARIETESQAEITVIIGNPPYNVGQQNENDNNKNRQYKRVEGRIRDTYAKDSKATLKMQLYDAYVKFFRWATDRLGDRDGIICFVSNNSFVRKLSFDGMRKHLANDFTHIYHIDLGGDAREGGGGNVFGIKVGVGITLLIRHRSEEEALKQNSIVSYWKVEDNQSGAAKLEFLEKTGNVIKINWQNLNPDTRYNWLTEGIRSEFATFLHIGTQEVKSGTLLDAMAIFKTYCGGVKTNRDDWAYDFNSDVLALKMGSFIETYNIEVDRWKRRGDRTVLVDDFVTYNEKKIKWSGDLKMHLERGAYATFSKRQIRHSLYRPFVKKYLYFDPLLNNRRYLQHLFFPTSASEAENVVIAVGGYGLCVME